MTTNTTPAVVVLCNSHLGGAIHGRARRVVAWLEPNCEPEKSIAQYVTPATDKHTQYQKLAQTKSRG